MWVGRGGEGEPPREPGLPGDPVCGPGCGTRRSGRGGEPGRVAIPDVGGMAVPADGPLEDEGLPAGAGPLGLGARTCGCGTTRAGMHTSV